MDKKQVLKNFLRWFLIVNVITFIGGLVDAFYWIPYGEKGGVGGFPVFTLYSIILGTFAGIIYSIINFKSREQSKTIKIIQLLISIFSIFIPILSLVGALLGMGFGYIIVKLFM
ncbi:MULTISPECIES: hypothetical protein [unclassified Clostridium]|uniref:hypothetical protein n=1 Tax=unclassified Clostridium TaxID=2614128 RepID=UPI001EED3F97|nr:MULTISPECIES: hypothetical protein [unclassified Clostridium]